MTKERFKEIQSNLHFSKDEEDFKVRWLIEYLNVRFLNCMEAKVEQSVDEHMLKYKGKRIIPQHIKNNPIKWHSKDRGNRFWLR